jgi:hypothetical protein
MRSASAFEIRGARRVRSFALLCLTALLAPAAAADPVAFGARSLEIPAPAGFVAVAGQMPRYLELSQAYLPAGNRLVEIYHSPADRDAMLQGQDIGLTRYHQLQTLRAFDGKPLSLAEFTAGMAQMETAIQATVENLDTAPLTDAGNKALAEQTGDDAAISIGDTRYLGVFRREPWALFFSTTSQVAISGADGHGGRVLCAGSAALINHQLVYLYAYTDDTGPEARSWAEAAVAGWADAVRAANPDDPAVAARAEAMRSSLDFPALGRNTLIGACTGGLLGLFFWLRRRA